MGSGISWYEDEEERSRMKSVQNIPIPKSRASASRALVIIAAESAFTS